jgi:hypothetical protein
MRETLMKQKRVAEHLEELNRACKGASVGRASHRCELLEQEFMRTVASAVRHTSELPVPKSAP